MPYLPWQYYIAMGETIFQNLNFLIFLSLFSVGALIMKVQSNKMCVSIKTTINIHFPLLWQLRNLQINKNI